MSVQRWNEETLVVTLADDPLISEDMDEIDALVKGGCCDIVLDLTGLAHLASSGISKLLRLRKKMNESGRRLVLCSPCDRVWTVFLATGLEGIFEFANNVSESLARLQGGRA